MKKLIIRYIKKALKFLLIAGITVVAYTVAHRIATAWRGYEALGGEAFIILVPFYLWVGPSLKGFFSEVKQIVYSLF